MTVALLMTNVVEAAERRLVSGLRPSLSDRALTRHPIVGICRMSGDRRRPSDTRSISELRCASLSASEASGHGPAAPRRRRGRRARLRSARSRPVRGRASRASRHRARRCGRDRSARPGSRLRAGTGRAGRPSAEARRSSAAPSAMSSASHSAGSCSSSGGHGCVGARGRPRLREGEQRGEPPCLGLRLEQARQQHGEPARLVGDRLAHAVAAGSALEPVDRVGAVDRLEHRRQPRRACRRASAPRTGCRRRGCAASPARAAAPSSRAPRRTRARSARPRSRARSAA